MKEDEKDKKRNAEKLELGRRIIRRSMRRS